MHSFKGHVALNFYHLLILYCIVLFIIVFKLLLKSIFQTNGRIKKTLVAGPPDACEEATRPRHIQGTSVIIQSPNYPAPYEGNDHCEWHFESTESSVICFNSL